MRIFVILLLSCMAFGCFIGIAVIKNIRADYLIPDTTITIHNGIPDTTITIKTLPFWLK